MNETELEKRKARAANETLVIVPTEGGFRVYNPVAIANIYMVSGVPESPKCNCPDFDGHKSDPEWRCKHIFAVLKQLENHNQPEAVADTSSTAEQKKSDPQPTAPAEKKKFKAARNGKHSHLLIKRSVSPDGRIDSLSVEFSNPIDWSAEEEIKQQAKRALVLGAAIAKDFLQDQANGASKASSQIPEKTNGSATQNSQSQPDSNGSTESSEGPIQAQLLNVAGMNTRSGWRLFINVQVNGTTIKLFGSKGQLADYIAAAGFASIANHIDQGIMLNLPCRVITKPSADGKYLNIERVLPLKPLEKNGRARQ